MSTDSGKITGYAFIGVPLLLTLLFAGKLIWENITHSANELPLIGHLAFSVFELIWLSFPYVVMLHFFNKHVMPVQKIYLDYLAICIVSAVGLFMFVTIRFIHLDAQGPIALQTIPIVQFGIYALLSAVINKVRHVPVGRNTSEKLLCQECGEALSDTTSKYCPKCGQRLD